MYSAEILTIGNEVLFGKVVNANAAFLSRELQKNGIEVVRHTTVPDELEIIVEAIQEGLASTPLLFVTGGLGPTIDDLTREAICRAFSTPLEWSESLENELKTRFGNHASLKNQATQPKGALLLKNRLGSASGLVLHNGRSTLVALPGVPLEMHAMFTEEVVPFLETNFSHYESVEEEILHFTMTSESEIDPILREIRSDFPGLKIGIYPANGLVSVVFRGEARQASVAKQKVLQQFSDRAFFAEDGRIECALHDAFLISGKTLSIAESCTGGEVASRLVHYPSASKYFLGGVVCYSNALKHSLLSVPNALLEEKGAVSKEVALAMCEGVQKVTKSDFALSITGIAGPEGGSIEKPVGTVFVAVKGKGEAVAFSILARGSREMIIDRAAIFSLTQTLSLLNRESK